MSQFQSVVPAIFMIINYVTQFDNAVFIYLFVSLFEFPKCY